MARHHYERRGGGDDDRLGEQRLQPSEVSEKPSNVSMAQWEHPIVEQQPLEELLVA